LPQSRHVEPPLKANSTPTLPSGGLLSKLTLTGPESISPMPDRPASRQKGRL
jgi:hypothetical protein